MIITTSIIHQMGTADSMDGAETNGNNQGDNCLSVIIRYAEALSY